MSSPVGETRRTRTRALVTTLVTIVALAAPQAAIASDTAASSGSSDVVSALRSLSKHVPRYASWHDH